MVHARQSRGRPSSDGGQAEADVDWVAASVRALRH